MRDREEKEVKDAACRMMEQRSNLEFKMHNFVDTASSKVGNVQLVLELN
jgi:hypothetical protein